MARTDPLGGPFLRANGPPQMRRPECATSVRMCPEGSHISVGIVALVIRHFYSTT